MLLFRLWLLTIEINRPKSEQRAGDVAGCVVNLEWLLWATSLAFRLFLYLLLFRFLNHDSLLLQVSPDEVITLSW